MIEENISACSRQDYALDQFRQPDFPEIVSTYNREMKIVFELIRSVAPTKSTVLLTGETGTGKGVLARLVHYHSNRAQKQFIPVHCGAIPETLMESELFGHEKGAFTSAVSRKRGKFEMAMGGTIFLDEIGTLTLSAQIKLLQVLQDGTFQRVGGEETIQAEVRVISATNANLESMCSLGQFRKDLFSRLNVFPIEIPSLRKRMEDIPSLANHFLKLLNIKEEKNIHCVAPDVMEYFEKYSWPGNIREMENVMERAYIMETSKILTSENLPIEIKSEVSSTLKKNPQISKYPLQLSELRRKAVEFAESTYLRRLLEEHRGKIKESANTAGISTRQLHKLLCKYGLRKEEFKPCSNS